MIVELKSVEKLSIVYLNWLDFAVLFLVFVGHIAIFFAEPWHGFSIEMVECMFF